MIHKRGPCNKRDPGQTDLPSGPPGQPAAQSPRSPAQPARSSAAHPAKLENKDSPSPVDPPVFRGWNGGVNCAYPRVRVIGQSNERLKKMRSTATLRTRLCIAALLLAAWTVAAYGPVVWHAGAASDLGLLNGAPLGQDSGPARLIRFCHGEPPLPETAASAPPATPDRTDLVRLVSLPDLGPAGATCWRAPPSLPSVPQHSS
jgi:hypothetical protein